jgi:phosphoribosylanthranilate isomerase
MKIKVCGLKFPENIELVAALNPDYMGFIFYKNSPRFICDLNSETLKTVPASISKTAVFVNETAENIRALINEYNFDTIQLHGSETADFCSSFKDKVKVIKAFGLTADFDFEQLKDYVNKMDFFLFDAKTDIYGGSGNTFDWSVLNKYNFDVPFFLSGGIGPANIEEVKNIIHPQLFGVDLNSKFEDSPGIKNIAQLKKAFEIVKKTYNHELRG